jgi:hypothetical protein
MLPEPLPLEVPPEPDPELPPLDPLLPEDALLVDELPLLFAPELVPLPELPPPPLLLDTLALLDMPPPLDEDPLSAGPVPTVASAPLAGWSPDTSRPTRPPHPTASATSTVGSALPKFIASRSPIVEA